MHHGAPVSHRRAARRPSPGVACRQGRWVGADRPEEVLAGEAFVEANGLRPGDHVSVVINGRWRRLTIVGVALSPEYVYSIRAGEIVPDDRRFGVFWMERRALASAFDMDGAFNDAVLSLMPGASSEEVVKGVDRLLEPYGSRGAIPRALQPSHWILNNELVQLQAFGFLVPLIFLLVAAFVLNVALARMLALQRPQVAALKALGYGNAELAWHYLKWAMLIAAAGALAGVVSGRWLGRQMLEIYNEFFRFPVLLFHLSPRVVLVAFLLSLGAAAAGALSAVRRAVAIPPAEAMRPEPPARYRRSLLESTAVRHRLTTASRMVLRNIGRHPLRAAASVAGIACATGMLIVGFVFVDALESLVQTEFSVAERQDVSVSFFEPRSPDVLFALQRLPGVLAVEPQRVVAARLRAGHRSRNLAITGMPPDPQLRRVVDRDGRAVALPPAGVVLSRRLGDVLGVSPGQTVEVDVLEGRRPTLTVPIAGLVEDALGLSAYMDIDALHRLMRETQVLSGAAMLVDSREQGALAVRLKQLPAVAGVAFKGAVVENFRKTLTEAMGLVIFMNVIFAAIIAFGVVYNAARVSLSERSLPVDGVVLKRHRESEGVVAMGEALLDIGDPTRLEVVADLLSTDAVRVKAGDAVRLEQWGGDVPLQARVRRVEPAGFMKVSALGVEEQRVNVLIDFEAPREAMQRLGDGYRVEVRIVIWEQPDVLKVPIGALFRRGDQWALFLVDGGRARLRTVEIGQRNAQEAQALEGLDAGDELVLHPPDTLRDGMRVARRQR